MALDKQQLGKLLASVAATQEAEIDCDACLADMAEFAELELLGADIPEALQRVRAHLELCSECVEEYEALLEAIRTTPADTRLS